jgi:nucleoside-diphosphate-sugar epimerase
MPRRILILGAAGRLGRAAAEAFRDAGWHVESQVRARSAPNIAPGTKLIEVDACDGPSLVECASQAEIVLHALNPEFSEWPLLVPHFAEIAIASARRAGGTLMFVGNLYNYGSPLPPEIDETTPMRPTSRKGELRLAAEERMRAAAAEGVRTIILRAGDFFGGTGRGSWFDRMIVKDLQAGRVTYPGSPDTVHEWAYLPDVASTLVRLAEKREALPPFAAFGFPGHAVTGRELVDALSHAVDRPLTIGKMPWVVLRLLGPLIPIFGELAELRYLWQQPHRIDGRQLRAAIGEVPHTPLRKALVAALDDLGLSAPMPGRR